MSIPGNANPLLLASAAADAVAAAGPTKSVRFNSGDSAYLNRTPSSTGNRRTWTWSSWVKLCKDDTNNRTLFSTGTNSSTSTDLRVLSSGYLNLSHSGSTIGRTDMIFRDTSAWYHIVCAFDSTQSVQADRIKIYVNGVLQSLSTSSCTLNLDSFLNNSGTAYKIGSIYDNDSNYFLDGYLADTYLIDGSALGATSFGAFDDNGVWQAATYSGTFGTNGFHLFDFANESTVGNDSSGNDNDFTANNISTTAGAGNDVLFDVPVNGTQSDTGAGGEVSGNYATLNPLFTGSAVTLLDGNLQHDTSSSIWDPTTMSRSAFGMATGKYYWEVSLNTNQYSYVGIAQINKNHDYVGSDNNTCGYYTSNGLFYGGGAQTAQPAVTYTPNAILMLAYDADAKKLWVGQNGTWFSVGNNAGDPANGNYPSFTGFGSNGEVYTPAISTYGTVTAKFNFGARPYAYTAPSGYKALCTTNLPTPTITDGSDYFGTKLYTGNGSTQTISGLEFSPDLVWIKSRSHNFDHLLFDQVRGALEYLSSNTTSQEATDSASLTAFTTDGFSVGSSSSVNQNNSTLVAWTWDAGSSTVSNTDGDITSNVRANQTAGFSIVSYTGNGTAGETIGHGLNAAPEMIIVKNRDSGLNWPVGHQSLDSSSPWTKNLYLNSNGGLSTLQSIWNNTAPTNSVFTVGASSTTNSNGDAYIAYCFTSVANYSQFGIYEGNQSTDGPFVHLGFKPAFILIKCSSGTGSWMMYDTARDTFNVAKKGIAAQLSFAETGNELDSFDIVSNGFKIRNTSLSFNSSISSQSYIYVAFAENPFQANGGLAR